MAQQYTSQIKLQFTADTSSAQKSLQNLSRSLKEVTALDKTGLGHNLSASMKEAISSAKTLQQALQSAVNVDTGKLNLNQFMSNVRQAGTNVNSLILSLQGAGSQGAQAFRHLASSIAMAEVPIKQMNGLLGSMMTSLANTVKWQISSSAIHGLMSGFSSAVGYAKDLNTSLNNIRIVTGQSVDDMARFAEKANAAAKALSTTTNAYAKASLIYYQQGDTAAEAARKAEITLKAANASFNTSAEEMSEYLTAVWNSYQVGADELERYVDIMAALGAKTATSLEEIATSMQKVAATANAVGVSMEEVSSIISTVSSVTRESAESIGTSFKTIFARIGDLKLGETLEDGVGLGQVSSALKKINVDILDSAGNMREMGDIITDLGNRWQTLSQAQKTATAQVVAGKRQYTQFMALFENLDMYNKNLNIAGNADGELQKQANIYAQSWEGASNRVRAAWEGVWSSLIDDEALIDMMNKLAEFIGGIEKFINNIGGMAGVMSTLGSVAMSVFGSKIAASIDGAVSKVKDFVNSFGHIEKGWARVASFFTKNTFQRNMEQMTKGLKAGMEVFDRQAQGRLGTNPSPALKNQIAMERAQLETTGRLLETKNQLVQIQGRLNEAGAKTIQNEINGLDNIIAKLEEYKQAHQKAQGDIAAARGQLAGQGATRIVSQEALSKAPGFNNLTPAEQARLLQKTAVLDAPEKNLFSAAQGNATQAAGAAKLSSTGMQDTYAQQTQMVTTYKQALETLQVAEQKVAAVQGDSKQAMQQKTNIMTDAKAALTGYARAAQDAGFPEVAKQITTMANNLHNSSNITTQATQAQNLYNQSSQTASQMAGVLTGKMGLNEAALEALIDATIRSTSATLQSNAAQEQSIIDQQRVEAAMKKLQRSIGNSVAITTEGIMNMGMAFNSMSSLIQNFDESSLGDKLTSVAMTVVAFTKTITTAIANPSNPLGWIMIALQAITAVLGAISGANEKAKEEQKKTDETARKNLIAEADALKEETNATKDLLTNFNSLLDQKRQGLEVDEELKTAAIELAAKYNITGQALNSLQTDYEEFVQAIQANALDKQIGDATTTIGVARGVIENNSSLFDNEDNAGAHFGDIGYGSDAYNAAVAAGYAGVGGVNLWSLGFNHAVTTQDFGGKVTWSGITGGKSNRNWFREVGLDKYILNDDGQLELLLSSGDSAEYKISTYEKLQSMYDNLVEAGEQGSDLGVQISLLLDLMSEEMDAYYSAIESLGELKIQRYANQWAGRTYESTSDGIAEFAEDYNSTYQAVAEEIKETYMKANNISNTNVETWTEEQQQEYQSQINSAMQTIMGSNSGVAHYFSAMQTLFNAYDSDLNKATKALEKITNSISRSRYSLNIEDIDAEMAEMYQLTGGMGEQWNAYLLQRSTSKILETMKTIGGSLENLNMSDDMTYSEMSTFFTEYETIRKELYEKFGIEIKTFDELMLLPWEERMAYIDSIKNGSSKAMAGRARDYATATATEADVYWDTGATGTDKILKYDSVIAHTLFDNLGISDQWNAYQYNRADGSVANGIAELTEVDWARFDTMLQQQNSWDAEMLGYLYGTDAEGNTYLRGEDEVVIKDGVIKIKTIGEDGTEEWSTVENSAEWLASSTGQQVSGAYRSGRVHSFYEDTAARQDFAYGSAMNRAFGLGLNFTAADRQEIAQIYGAWSGYRTRANTAWDNNEAAQQEVAVYEALEAQTNSVTNSIKQLVNVLKDLPTSAEEFSTVAEKLFGDLGENAEEILASSTDKMRAQAFLDNNAAFRPDESQFQMTTYKNWATGEVISEGEYQLLTVPEQGFYNKNSGINWAGYSEARAEWIKGQTAAFQILSQDDVDLISEYSSILTTLTSSYKAFIETGTLDTKTQQALLLAGINPDTIETIEDYEQAITTAQKTIEQSTNSLLELMQSFTKDIEIDWSKATIGTTWEEFIAAQNEEVQKYLLSDEGSWMQQFYEQWHTSAVTSSTALDGFSASAIQTATATTKLTETLKQQQEEWKKITEAAEKAKSIIDSFASDSSNITFEQIHELKNNILDAGLALEDFESYISVLTDMNASEEAKTAAMRAIEGKIGMANVYNAYDQALPYMSTTVVIDNYLVNGNTTTTPIEEQYNTEIGYGFTATGDTPDGAAADIIDHAETGESGGNAGTAVYTYKIEQGTATNTTIYDADDFAIVERINNAGGDVNAGTATYVLVIKNGDGTTQNIDLTDNQKWLIDNWDTLAGDSALPLNFIFTVGQVGTGSLPSNWEAVYNSFTAAMKDFTDPDKGRELDTIPLKYYFKLFAEVDPNDEEGIADFDWMYLMDDQGNLLLDDYGNPQFDIGLINLVYDYQFIPADSKNPVDELRKNIWEIVDLDMDKHPDPHNLGLLTYTADMLFEPNPDFDPNEEISEANSKYLIGEDGKYVYKTGLDLDALGEETQYTMYWRWQYNEVTGNDCPPGYIPEGDGANFWAQYFNDKEKAQVAYWAMQHLAGGSDVPPGFKEENGKIVAKTTGEPLAEVFVEWSMKYSGKESPVETVIKDSLSDEQFESQEAYDVEYSRRLAYIFSLELDDATLTSEQGLRDALSGIEGGWENAAREYGIGLTAPVRLSVIDTEYQLKKGQIESTTLVMGVRVEFKEGHRLHRFMELYDDPNTTEAEMRAFVETLPPVLWKTYGENGIPMLEDSEHIDWDKVASILLQDYGSSYSLATLNNATMPGGEVAAGERRSKVENPTEDTVRQLEATAALAQTFHDDGSIAIDPSRLPTILAPWIGEDGKIPVEALPEGYLETLISGGHWNFLETLAPMLGDYGGLATLELLQHYASQGDEEKIRQILVAMGVIDADGNYDGSKLAAYGLTERYANSLGYYLEHPELYAGINQGFDIRTGTYITPTAGTVLVGKTEDGEDINYSFTESSFNSNGGVLGSDNPHDVTIPQIQEYIDPDNPTFSEGAIAPVSSGIYYLKDRRGDLYRVQHDPDTGEYYMQDSNGQTLVVQVTKDELSKLGGELIYLPEDLESFANGAFSGLQSSPFKTDFQTNSGWDEKVYERYVVPTEDGGRYFTYLTYDMAHGGYVGRAFTTDTITSVVTNGGGSPSFTGTQYGNRFIHFIDSNGINRYGMKDYSDDGALAAWETMLENGTGARYIQNELQAIAESRLLRKDAIFLSSWINTLSNTAKIGTPEMIDRASKNIASMLSEIFGNAIPEADMPKLIGYLIEGLTTGDWSAMLADEVLKLNLGETLYGTLCTVFQIHSPSRLTQEIGAFIMQGLQKGINDNSEIEFDAVIKSVLAGLSNLEQQIAKGIEGMSFHDVLTEAITSAFGINLDTFLAYLGVDPSTLDLDKDGKVTKDEKMAALFKAQDIDKDGTIDKDEQTAAILNVQHAQLGINTTGHQGIPMLSDTALVNKYNSLTTNDERISFLRTLGIDPTTLAGHSVDENTQVVTAPIQIAAENVQGLYQHYLDWIGAKFDKKGKLEGFEQPDIDLGEAAVRMLFDPTSDYHYSKNSNLDPSVQAAFQLTMNAIKSEHADWFDENGNLKMTSYGPEFLNTFWTEWEETGTEAIRKIQTEWQRQKGIWEKSFSDYVSQTQKANEKALKIWQSTFKTITNLHKELGSGKTLKEIFAGDEEGLANWAATMTQAGYTYQDLTNWYDGVSTNRSMPALDLTQMSMQDYANKRGAVGQSVGVRYNPVTGMPIFESATIANKRIMDYYNTTEGRNKILSAMGLNVQDTIQKYNAAVASGNQEGIQLYKAVLDTFMNEFKNVLTYDEANNAYTLNTGADGTITLSDSTTVEDIVKLVLASQGFTDETYTDYMHREWAAYMVQRDQFYSTYTQGWNNDITQNTSDIAILEKVQTSGEGGLSWEEYRRYRQIITDPTYAGMTTQGIIDSMRDNTAAARDNILATDAYLAKGWFLQEGPNGMYWAKYGDTYGAASTPVTSDSSTDLTSLFGQFGITEATFAGKEYQAGTVTGTEVKTSNWIDDGSGGQVQYTITKTPGANGTASYQISTQTRSKTAVEVGKNELDAVAGAAATDYDDRVALNNRIATVEPRLTAISGIKDLERGDKGWGAAISSLREAFAEDQNALAVIEELNTGAITWEEANARLTSATLLSRDSIIQMTEAQWKQYQATLAQNGVMVKGYKTLEDYFSALDNIRRIQGKITDWSTKTTKQLNEQDKAWKAAKETTEDYSDDLAVLGKVIKKIDLKKEFGIKFKEGADPAAVNGALSDLAENYQYEVGQINEALNSDLISEAGIGWDTLLDIQGLVDADTNFRQATELVLQDLGITDQRIIDTLASIGGEEFTPVYGLMATILGAVDPAQYNTIAQALMAWADEMDVELELPLLDETATLDNKGKGGGGGGGKKKPTERKKYSEVERYHEIEGTTKAIEDEMSKIEKLRERTFGPEKLKTLEAELALLEKQKEAQEALLAEASTWLKSDQELLNSLVDGVEYMEDGRIANWSELQHQWIDEYNAAVAVADKIKDDEKKQEALNAAKKEYDRKIEALENYEESLDKVLEAGLELEDLVNQISAKLLEKIQYNVEYKMDLNESDLEIMEYYLDTFEDDVFKSAESMDNMMEQITTHLDDLKTLKEGYNELIKEYNNGAGLITDADFQAGLKEFQSQIIDTLSELNELKKEMKEFYEDVLENASEELENHTEKLDAIVETMESYISIQELMGKGVNYEWVTGIYQTQYEANRALLTANKQYLDTLIQARDEATDPDLIEAYNDAIVEANESLLESTEAVLETLQKIYENTIASIFETLDKALAGTADSVEELSEDYAYYQEVQERYVSTAKELYEVSKLNRDIEKSINETASQTHKNLLKQLQERINAQSELNELTQYDLEMNQKQYDLLLAKIALEEAQNAKDTVRLVRDANGNYSYQYTADQSKINEAEQKYEDALYAIHELSAKRIKEMEQEMIDARKTFLDSAKEIAEAEYESEEERYEDLLKLFDQYKERMTYSYAEYEEATNHLGVNAQSFAELFGVSVDEIYGGSSLISEALGALFALGADATFEDAWAAIQAVMEAAREREEAVQDATDDAGTSLDDMSGNAESASGAIDGLIDEITDLNTRLGEEFIEVNKVADAWLRLHEVLSSTSFDYEQIAENMQKLQEAIGTDGLGLILGDIIINDDAMAGTQDTEDQIGYYDDDGVYHQYATGGLVDYTGPAWVDGTPDKPELMLNATDTPRFLEAIKIARQINFRRGFGDSSLGQYANIISDTLEASMAAMYDVMANSYHATDSAFRILSAIKSEPIDQNVIIDAHFPNVTNHTEIEDALSNLINQASQFTNRNF